MTDDVNVRVAHFGQYITQLQQNVFTVVCEYRAPALKQPGVADFNADFVVFCRNDFSALNTRE